MSQYLVSIPRPLASKALLLSFLPRAALAGLAYFGLLYFLIWVVIAAVDTYNNQGPLIGQHGYALIACYLLTVAFNTVRSFQLRKQGFLAKEYRLQVTSHGITCSFNDTSLGWKEFAYFREFADYLLLVSTNKVTIRRMVLPKTDVLAPALAVVRQHLPRKGWLGFKT